MNCTGHKQASTLPHYQDLAGKEEKIQKIILFTGEPNSQSNWKRRSNAIEILNLVFLAANVAK